jgi:hypothetical protein
MLMKDEEVIKLFDVQEVIFPEYEDYDYVDMDEVVNRSERIQKISEDSNMIHEMFKDLQELIYGQQDVIDTIEDNVSHSKHYVEKAEEELVVADIYQSKSNRTYLLLSTILIAGISTPVGISLGVKTGLGTAGGMGLGSIFYKMF